MDPRGSRSRRAGLRPRRLVIGQPPVDIYTAQDGRPMRYGDE